MQRRAFNAGRDSLYSERVDFRQPLEDLRMKWETPKYDDIRFGFEVTMYINNR